MRTILLIEDNRQLSAALTRCLLDEGHVVEAAYDGAAGQDYAEAAPTTPSFST
ncbi:MAG: hypothetical protein U0232_20725 [Thermomicrobiales bacterium]